MKAVSVVICSLLMVRAASGQDEEQRSEPDTWFEITPYLWMAGMKGTVGVKGLSTEVGKSFSDLISDIDAGAMATARFRTGNFVVTGDFNWIKLSADGDTPGNLFSGAEVEAETIMASLSLGYRLPMGTSGHAELFVGARGWMVDSEIRFAAGTLPALQISDDNEWVDPIIGARFHYQLGKSWSIGVLLDVGGFDVSSSTTSAAVVGATWHLSDHFGISLAYRYLADDFEDDGFTWDIAEHGFILGVSIRF
ncbi:MAG: hypothetical protein EHM91_08690 [Planctomycetota bacterium]|nr:MAG: hypothetical protein EHM91_08690 [Planctomycetota bacterium]